MNGYTGISQSIFYILLQMVTHPVCLLETGILGQHQMKVYKPLASRFPGS